MFDIVYWPESVLKKVSEPVSDFDGLDYIVERLYETMAHHRGMGLSAPQVGMLKRILVMRREGEPFTMINPEIVSKAGSIRYSEGCLSFPGLFVEVERASNINVRWQDLSEEWNEDNFQGIAAVCIQHEIDHLNGVTMLNYAPQFQRETITRKMRGKKYEEN